MVGPEAPLSVGVADALQDAGIAVFGPGRDAAMLETSKAFCHEVAKKAGVRTARARAFAAATSRRRGPSSASSGPAARAPSSRRTASPPARA